ncbi:pentatricopeptide repeat-containing protein At3g29290 isoform X2 [Daucus carota subsp. sativus]|uniref:pentatricopeptide repeat-containing protein At3g29290 isoform X2 n=1 Tax=Daucus carota subsp. sativus TaxID=79200 RepID=UPI0007F03F97|nr:PREDICTED: pentatricopeptide repeat-containing protein At3g29290 isoform X2 [Daucus carota subsp. sativus]
MALLLKGSVAVTLKCNGCYSYEDELSASKILNLRNPCLFFNCSSYFGSEIKANTKRAKLSGNNCVLLDGLHSLTGLRHSKMATTNNLVRVSSTNRNVSSFKNVLVENEKDNFDAESMNQESPPWGNVEIKGISELMCDGGSVALIKPRGEVVKMTNTLCFLEETDEEVLSNRILKLSRSNKVVSALSLYRSMEFSGLRANLHACNSLLSCLVRNQVLDEALKIFEILKESEMTTGHTYSLILKAIANAWGCNAALNMYEDLSGNSYIKKKFDAIAYNTMLSICGKVNDWVQAERIWRNLNDNGRTGTALTYRLLVCIFVRCSQNELALDAYREMIQNSLEPTDDMMQAIIGACSKEGEWDMGLSVFHRMLNQGMKPNAVACNALINSLGKANKANLALKVYGIMKSLGHIPDAYTWNAILGALYKAEEHADVLRLFQNLQAAKKSKISLHMYNTALMSCKRLGAWDRALQLLWHMESSGLPISTVSYNLVIGTCEVARRPKIALQVYERMLHQHHTPDLFTLLSLIRSCIWGSLWHEMEQVLKVPQNASLYNVSIQGMFLRGKIDSAKKLYKEMQENGCEPDGKTRALMLQYMRKHSVRRARRRRLTQWKV